jgi:hypothetical protein
MNFCLILYRPRFRVGRELLLFNMSSPPSNRRLFSAQYIPHTPPY